MKLLTPVAFLAIFAASLVASSPCSVAQEPETVEARRDFPLVADVTTDRVNLRTGPSKDYRILRQLEPNEKIVLVEENGDWFGARVPAGFTGYVLNHLLDLTSDHEGVVKEDRVNLRPTPSTQYFPAGQLLKGETVLVVGQEGDWLRVVAPARMHAYVSKEYVRVLGPESEFEGELRQIAANARTAYLASAGKPEAAAEEAQRLQIRGEFDEAESLYRQAQDQENPDYSRAADLYRKVAAQEALPDLATLAKTRLESIEQYDALHKTIAEAKGVEEKLSADLEAARRKYEEELRKIREEKAAPAIQPARSFEVGWIVRHTAVSPFGSAEPEFKLLKGGRVLCHLESRKYDLRDFLDRQVIATGDFVTNPDTKLRVMLVRQIEILARR